MGAPKKLYLATDLESYDIPQTGKTVARIVRKIFGGIEVIDVRLWHLNRKQDAHYPSRHQGICLKADAWKEVIKIFQEKLSVDIYQPSADSTVPQTDS